MHQVPIKDLRQYEKAIEVLARVGGAYQGIGQEEWVLLVSDTQFQALLDAKVVTDGDGAKDQDREARPSMPADVLADYQEVCRQAASGKIVGDAKLLERISERSKAVREEALRRFGIQDIGVAIIRELRDGR